MSIMDPKPVPRKTECYEPSQYRRVKDQKGPRFLSEVRNPTFLYQESPKVHQRLEYLGRMSNDLLNNSFDSTDLNNSRYVQETSTNFQSHLVQNLC